MQVRVPARLYLWWLTTSPAAFLLLVIGGFGCATRALTADSVPALVGWLALTALHSWAAAHSAQHVRRLHSTAWLGMAWALAGRRAEEAVGREPTVAEIARELASGYERSGKGGAP